MVEAQEVAAKDRPLWRRIVNYPLVALLIAVALFIAASALAMILGKPLQPMPQVERTVLRAIIGIVLVVGVYKLVIAKLGEQPRDDLRLDKDAGRNLGLGLLTGFAIMAIAVGIAAVLGVYRIVGPGDTSRLVL